ncbi:DUF2125 domain-containing protein [Hyphobacterium marinum]|uniref:DUF2125 domain-containing protein n=1 Tax=Hyphobacterium marinum TaxID=3116574 RepID=A0ABU7LXR0_9PROT|nr:DUF2125 domain-containing protein [Hyphobacterium sp. Y6023]MEE2566338.1 DUF2125 domain-containing protein [Hyphobacterium sp. Y6023]
MNRFKRGAIGGRFLLLALIILGLFMAYTGYWFYARSQIIASTEAWIDEQGAAGYVITRERLNVGGFPYRFEVVIDRPHIEAPDTEGGWTADAERLTAHALPYDFSRWIVDVGTPIMVDWPTPVRSVHRVEATHARISLSGNGRSTQRLGVELDGLNILTLEGEPRPVRSAERMRLVAESNDDGIMQVRAAFGEIRLNPEFGDGRLREAFGEDVALAQLGLSIQHWPELARNGDAGEWARARGRMVILDTRLDWGDLDISAEGDITLDGQLRPEGRLSLYFLDPGLVADRLESSGVISADDARALRLLSQAAPRDERGSALPLLLRNGGIYLGPVRLGETGSLAEN